MEMEDGSDGWKIHGMDLNEGCNILQRPWWRHGWNYLDGFME